MRVTPEEIIQMNELYLEYRTYSAVAREVGRAPSTVKRYIDPNYISQKTPTQLFPIDWEKLESAPIVKIPTWEQTYLERKHDERILS